MRFVIVLGVLIAVIAFTSAASIQGSDSDSDSVELVYESDSLESEEDSMTEEEDRHLLMWIQQFIDRITGRKSTAAAGTTAAAGGGDATTAAAAATEAPAADAAPAAK